MVANNYLNDGITNPEVVDLIVLGFTGKLLDWWTNCMTTSSKDDIKHAVQKDEDENLQQMLGKKQRNGKRKITGKQRISLNR